MRKVTRIYTGGTFDLLHFGHIRLFIRAKSMADYLIVSLNTDEFVKQYKKSSPVLTYEARKELLEACRYVDEVIPNVGGYDSKPAILRAKPNYIIHGDDWTGESYMKQLGITQKFLKDNKIELVYTPYTKAVSTTMIKNRIMSKV